MSVKPAGQYLPRLTAALQTFANGWNQLGTQIAFNVKTVQLVREALVRYKLEILRVIAQMSLGTGMLAVIGGTVVIVTFLVASVGANAALFGHAALGHVGVDALGGFFSAYVSTRVASPLITNIALVATIGAGATAQLGAMRIAEEIDALEAMSIRPIAYLASTRVISGVIVAIPLFCLSAESAYLVFDLIYTIGFSQPNGAFSHYFYTYLKPSDILWAMLQAVGTAFLIMLVHTYYGFNASGGPAGVGEAVGRAVRAGLVVAMVSTLVIGMAVYGASGDFNLSG